MGRRHLDTFTATVGQWYGDAKGTRYQVTRITPAGSAGTSRADGPTVHLTIDGQPGRFTADVRTGSTSHAPSNYYPLQCEDCGALVLDEMACPNDSTTCVDCCPCHREDDAAPGVSDVEAYGCDACGATVATSTYVTDCGTCGGIGTVYASSVRLTTADVDDNSHRPTDAAKIDNAAIMFGTGSPQHLAAIRRFSPNQHPTNR
jgi:hypothetical protein